MQRSSKPGLALLLVGVLFLCSCRTSRREAIYSAQHQLKLDVYSPRRTKAPKPVMIFIHGGNWNSGTKSMYSFIGRGFARKGVVTVVIDYRLSQLTTYDGMAKDAAMALRWVKDNIAAYGGDPARIFLSGHSAGGHLAALIAADYRYLDGLNLKGQVRGAIMIDAFGMDMYTYLKESTDPNDSIFIPAFTTLAEEHTKASPIYYLSSSTPPFFILLGGNTKPKIISDNNRFLEAIRQYKPETNMITIKGKKHVGMITQYLNPWNASYKQIVEFMGR